MVNQFPTEEPRIYIGERTDPSINSDEETRQSHVKE